MLPQVSIIVPICNAGKHLEGSTAILKEDHTGKKQWKPPTAKGADSYCYYSAPLVTSYLKNLKTFLKVRHILKKKTL